MKRRRENGSSDFVVNSQKFADLKRAVDSLSVSNSFLAIQGPSGCGKMTALKKSAEELDLKIVDITDQCNTDVSSIAVKWISFDSLLSNQSSLQPFLLVISQAAVALGVEKASSLCLYLNSKMRSTFRLKGIVFTLNESLQDEAFLRIFPSMQLVKMRALTNIAVKKIIKFRVPDIDSGSLEDIVQNSNGDGRFALNAAQLRKSVSKDEEITFFHAVARTLHCKRETYHPNEFEKIPCVSDNPGGFRTIFHENSFDYLQDISKLGNFLEISSFSDKFALGENLPLTLCLFGWAGIVRKDSSSHQPPRNFHELRKSKFRENSFVKNALHCLGSEKVWFFHILLTLSLGSFPKLPNWALEAVHNICTYKSVEDFKFPGAITTESATPVNPIWGEDEILDD